jgi:hypothetical protein
MERIGLAADLYCHIGPPEQNRDQQLQTDMEQMAFNPWHTKDFRPLGLINLVSKKTYAASAKTRGSSLQPYQ